MGKMKSLDEVQKYYEERIGGQDLWGPRGRVFILAELSSLKFRADELEKELRFERAVNERVRDAFSAWLGIKEKND